MELGLNAPMLLTAFICTLVFLIPWWRMCRRGKRPPGPTPLPIVGNLLQLKSGQIVKSLLKMRDTYGSVFTVYIGNRRIVVLCGYEAIKEALLDQGDDFVSRGSLPAFETIFRGLGLGVANGELWNQLRRFSLQTLRNFGMGKRSLEVQIQAEAQRLVNALRKTNQEPCDPTNLLILAPASVIFTIIVGIQFEYDDKRFNKLLHCISEGFHLVSTFWGQLYDMFPKVMDHLPGPHQKIFKYMIYLEEFLLERVTINQKTLDYNSPRDYIDCYLIRMEQDTENVTSEKREYGSYHQHEVIHDEAVCSIDLTLENAISLQPRDHGNHIPLNNDAATYIQCNDEECTYSFEQQSQENYSVIVDSTMENTGDHHQQIIGHVDMTYCNNYTPVVNDTYDAETDDMWMDVQATIQNENEELVFEDSCALGYLDSTVEETPPETVAEDDMPHINSFLYEGSQKTLGCALLLLISLQIRSALPDEAVRYIMIILHLLLPEGNRMFTSLYHMRAFLEQSTSKPDLQYYCSSCYTHCEKGIEMCPNKLCLHDLSTSDSVAYFVKLSIIEQLQSMFRRCSFTLFISTHRFDHVKQTGSALSDVYDGTNYRQLLENGFLKDPNSVSFSFNTDGVPVYKSSNISMWPVYLLVNELPLVKRKAKENIIMFGIWVSSRKPMMWSFLKPLFDELHQLENGVDMIDHEGEHFVCHGTLLNCTCDLPARCLVTNSMQYNGDYSCWYCVQKGQSNKLPSGGVVHVFPYQDNDPKGPIRTTLDVHRDVKQAVSNIQNRQQKYSGNGVKGPSWFSYLKHFPGIHGYVIDYMHGLCLGVTKLLLNLWFGVEHRQKIFSCYLSKDKVSNQLQCIKPTINITRPPRTLNDLPFWKSSELKNFLLYWGIPLMKGHLPKEHFFHFALFVRATYLLSQECINDSDLNIADICLLSFVRNFDEFYEERYITLNVHQLLHLTDSVRHNGPLFVNSCFLYEDLNGFFVKRLTGTVGVEAQLMHLVGSLQVLSKLSTKYMQENSKEQQIFQGLFNQDICSNEFDIECGISIIGSMFTRVLSDEEYSAVSQYSLLSTSVNCFLRINLTNRGFYVFGTDYTRLKKKKQCIIKYKCNTGETFGYGMVTCFINFQDANLLTNNLCIIKVLVSVSPQSKSHISVVKMTDSLSAIPLSNIINICQFVEADHVAYVCEVPNRYDRE